MRTPLLHHVQSAEPTIRAVFSEQTHAISSRQTIGTMAKPAADNENTYGINLGQQRCCVGWLELALSSELHAEVG